MFTQNFDPFAILKSDMAQKDLLEITERIRNKESRNYSRLAGNFGIMYLAHLSTSWLDILSKLNELQNKKEMHKFQIYQLNYLKNNPDKLGKVVETNLAISAIMLYHSCSITQIGGNVTDALNCFWNSIKNLSIDKGFEESEKEIKKRKEKNMWNILLSPIALLMNQKYSIGHNTKLCDDYLTNIIETSVLFHNVDSLCTEVIFESFMDTSILGHLKYDKYSYKRYIDSSCDNNVYRIIDNNIDFFLKYIEDPERIYL